MCIYVYFFFFFFGIDLALYIWEISEENNSHILILTIGLSEFLIQFHLQFCVYETYVSFIMLMELHEEKVLNSRCCGGK